MLFENLTARFENLEADRDYWFIRTSKGVNFEPFLNGGFIGINWNYVTARHLRQRNETEIRRIIAANETDAHGRLYDTNTVEGKKKITSIYNKIKRFQQLQENDIIVMPSEGSRFLSFGYITDEEIYEEFNDNQCDFHKRRRVHWIVTKELNELDPIYYKIIFSKHAVSNLNAYSSHIDKVISSLFVKDDRAHLVMQVRSEDEINFAALSDLMNSVRDLTSLINTEFNLQEDLSVNSIKLNVQSPGTIEFIYNNGRSLLLAALLLAIPMTVSCSHGELAQNATTQQVRNERNENLVRINDTIRAIDTLSQTEQDSLVNFADINYDTLAEAKQNMIETDSIINTQND